MNNQKLIILFVGLFSCGAIFSFESPFIDYKELNKQSRASVIQAYYDTFNDSESLLSTYCLKQQSGRCWEFFADIQNQRHHNLSIDTEVLHNKIEAIECEMGYALSEDGKNKFMVDILKKYK
jgi:hypothetical protein